MTDTRIRIRPVGPDRIAVWIGWVVFTLTMTQAEELFDKLGMVIEGITDEEIEALLQEGR